MEHVPSHRSDRKDQVVEHLEHFRGRDGGPDLFRYQVRQKVIQLDTGRRKHHVTLVQGTRVIVLATSEPVDHDAHEIIWVHGGVACGTKKEQRQPRAVALGFVSLII